MNNWKHFFRQLSIDNDLIFPDLIFVWKSFVFFILKKFSQCHRKIYQDTKVRLCSEGVTKLFQKGFDRQNSIFLHPHGKRKTASELHLSALNFESARAILIHLLSRKTLHSEQFFRILACFSMQILF